MPSHPERSFSEMQVAPVKAGKLHLIDQSLVPFTLPLQNALIQRLRQETPKQLHGKHIGAGDRADRGLVKAVSFEDGQQLVFKKVRQFLENTHTGTLSHQMAVEIAGSLDTQLNTYFWGVENARVQAEKNGIDLREIWPLEVPLAFFDGDDGEQWVISNLVPKAVPPRDGTAEVNAFFAAQNDRMPENVLHWARLRFLDTDLEGYQIVMTGDPQKGYRKMFVDFELIAPM